MSSRGYTKKYKFDKPKSVTKPVKAVKRSTKSDAAELQPPKEQPQSGSKLKGIVQWDRNIDLSNEFLFRRLNKRCVKYMDILALDLNETMHINFWRFLQYLKRLRFIRNKLVFDNTKIVHTSQHEIITILANKIRGLSLPLPIEVNKAEFVLRGKQIKRCNHIDSLKVKVFGSMTQIPISITSTDMVRFIKNNFISAKGLKSFGFHDQSILMKREAMELLTRVISLNSSTLTQLDLMIPALFRTYSGRKTFDSSSELFQRIGYAQNLERVYVQIDGEDVYDENVKQIANALSDKKNLKKVILKLVHPNILKKFEKLNAIKNLELHIEIKFTYFKTQNLKYVHLLDMPVYISVDEVTARRLQNEDFMQTFFDSLSQIKQLERFSYHEGFEDGLLAGRDNLVKYFPLVCKNFQNLKKIDFDLSSHIRSGELLKEITKSLKKMNQFEHFELSIFDHYSDSENDAATLELITALQKVKTLENLFISIDGFATPDSFTRKIIDRMCKCTQVLHLGSLCMKVSRKTLVYLFEKLAKMPNIASLILWLRPVGDLFEDLPGDPSWTKVIKTIVEGLARMKTLRHANLMFPFELDEEDSELFAQNVKYMNKFLNLEVQFVDL